METITKQTSAIAHEKVDKQTHYSIILKTLELCPYPLTAYGISKRCSLTYYQVDRRLKHLRDSEQVEITGKLRDIDGSIRAGYRLL